MNEYKQNKKYRPMENHVPHINSLRSIAIAGRGKQQVNVVYSYDISIEMNKKRHIPTTKVLDSFNTTFEAAHQGMIIGSA